MITRLCMRFKFKSIHTVPGENDADGNPLVHGHNYALILKLRASGDFEHWVTSRDLVNEIVQSRVLQHVNNKNLDLWLSPATGENICLKIWERLKDTALEVLLDEIELEETRKNIFNLKIQGA